jgi:hypothetical protein
MASGFGGYEEFLNIMRSDTTEDVTTDIPVTWAAVENTTVDFEKTLLDFGVLKSSNSDYFVPLGEGWGSATESSAYHPDTATTVITIRDAFMWMATYPGMVLIGTVTLGGNVIIIQSLKYH